MLNGIRQYLILMEWDVTLHLTFEGYFCVCLFPSYNIIVF